MYPYISNKKTDEIFLYSLLIGFSKQPSHASAQKLGVLGFGKCLKFNKKIDSTPELYRFLSFNDVSMRTKAINGRRKKDSFRIGELQYVHVLCIDSCGNPYPVEVAKQNEHGRLIG